MNEDATPVFRQSPLTILGAFRSVRRCTYVGTLSKRRLWDINQEAYIGEGLPTIDSTCSSEPKSTSCLQRARVVEMWLIVSKPLAKSMHAKLISLPVLRASLRSEATGLNGARRRATIHQFEVFGHLTVYGSLSGRASEGGAVKIAELTETYQGSCLPTFRKRPVGNSWLSGLNGMRSRDFITGLKLRFGVIETRSQKWRGRTPQNPAVLLCRHCGHSTGKRETAAHISQKCPQTKNLYIQRHNKIVHLAAEHARREGFTVHVEHALKSEGQVYKPDLILIKGNAAHVFDVAVPWETGTDMHEHHERKVHKYSMISDDVKAHFGVDSCTVGAIVVGARSSWCASNRATLKACNTHFTKRFKRLLCGVALEGTCRVFQTFFTNTTQKQKSKKYKTQKTPKNLKTKIKKLPCMDSIGIACGPTRQPTKLDRIGRTCSRVDAFQPHREDRAALSMKIHERDLSEQYKSGEDTDGSRRSSECPANTESSQMPRHLISDAYEWINKILSVFIYYLAKPQPRKRTALAKSAGKEDPVEQLAQLLWTGVLLHRTTNNERH
ncbi:Retrovirus-related Pol polyprotein from type-1 retrotransposable element [Trichinella nelsoni]|uniref:Retrovirus-related Pol polyprotein from type-1 retrotransposable element n=1 Tax=Trichinella nelsoni TaxID=6336 RepID=A0A0V0REC6_9BILA|nr:Retrovirus-related Pol polyprotein from type-1 retrotransposable element [Trichinella nelsoni]